MAIIRALNQEETLVCLILGFILSVLLRTIIGGIGVSTSPSAGLAFAGCLFLMTFARPTHVEISKKQFTIGINGALVLIIPTLILHGAVLGSHRPMGNFLVWGSVVGIVALAEEIFLRGTLFDAALTWSGPRFAVLLGAVAFTVLHIPLYGFHIIPLDLVVGAWLGLLRLKADSATAPAVSHILADWAGWWIR